jgi:hypothetical protein
MAVLDDLSSDDLRWLKQLLDSEFSEKKGRPVPFPVQNRLRGMGLAERRKGKLVLTRQGQEALAASRR